MGELLIFNVNKGNRLVLPPFCLLGLLSSESVQKQVHRLDFVDTTLPNLSDRWKELLLSIHLDEKEREKFSSMIEQAIKKKREAQKDINDLRQLIGGNIVT